MQIIHAWLTFHSDTAENMIASGSAQQPITDRSCIAVLAMAIPSLVMPGQVSKASSSLKRTALGISE